ncbi:MAG: ribosome-associated translation inhibitor RaiA [Bacteroidales bacterium]|nr:ribosome-associated translation inhibitor RaiA [Bacteroidales bacterium]
MEIKIQSVKFDADKRLVDFVNKKVERIAKFSEEITSVDVVLELLPDRENKCAKLKVHIPGNSLVVERHAKTFEDAITAAADTMKENIVRAKEKKN